ncbi:MAG: hypothetical protein O3C63_05735 [Cyanobacteria bacterium]|nr:hypothetical protein [Cyanobacteriota bacterium]MDA1021468.1 hypothetical protein [Cyanobacteriota bacterium]
MSKQESILKETGDLLESARTEVLKEINNGKGLLSSIFGDRKSESLKRAQSSISKAINQMQGINKDESGLVGKLQQHLNQKAEDLKKLEAEVERSQKETSELRDKIKFFQNQIEKQSATAKETKELKAPQEHHKIEQEFKAKIQELEESNRDIQIRFTSSQESLKESEELTAEFANRLKRLKSEITS